MTETAYIARRLMNCTAVSRDTKAEIMRLIIIENSKQYEILYPLKRALEICQNDSETELVFQGFCKRFDLDISVEKIL